MVTCWRCGVDFDGAPYLAGAPCPDCQEDTPGNWVPAKQHSGRLTEAEWNERASTIKELHQAGYLDPEIAARMGIGRSAVSRWRKRLGLKAHSRPEKHMWKDQDAHIEHASKMVEKRKTVGKGMMLRFEGSK